MNRPHGSLASQTIFTILGLSGWLVGSAMGSSHREAPLISQDPSADNTDVYAFVSYEGGRSNFVTLIANWIPFESPYGGPTYHLLNPDARYRIHVDNDGDAREDLSFQFSFENVIVDQQAVIGGIPVSIPLFNRGAIFPGFTGNQTVLEQYRIDLVEGLFEAPTRVISITQTLSGSQVFPKPVDNIGTQSITNYEDYARTFIHSINVPGLSTSGKVFVGQRKDSFFADIGGILDLLNIPNPTGSETGNTSNYENASVTTFALELPKEFLEGPGGNKVIGVWASAAVSRGRPGNGPDTNSDGIVDVSDVLNVAGSWQSPITSTFTAPAQVSRLGNPLVNMLIIGFKDKDRWNRSAPRNDVDFLPYFTNPVLPFHLGFLTGQQAPNVFPRQDVVEFFLSGIPGVNDPPGNTIADILRLNLDTPPVSSAGQNRLGVIGGDNAGWPNGRRPGDDVVDISLRALMGQRLPQADAPAGQLPWTDGVLKDATFFHNAFPYLTTPDPGGS
ncbi:MAG: DUF4331 domain-containing protein [Candidatus Omnitrophica bacterium]|nr:DUF4331 domain-containing protein [Candidatus Omnitrophota bacterium]